MQAPRWALVFVGLIICTYLVLMDTLVIVLDYLQICHALLFYILIYSTIYMSVLIDTLYNMYHTITYRSSTTTTQVTSLSLVSELD